VPRGRTFALASDDPAAVRQAWLGRENHAFLGAFPESAAAVTYGAGRLVGAGLGL
jgi:hypothetical protein